MTQNKTLEITLFSMTAKTWLDCIEYKLDLDARDHCRMYCAYSAALEVKRSRLTLSVVAHP